MLSSKLIDRLDKTGLITDENRDVTKKVSQCKTRDELRESVRELLEQFKRGKPVREALTGARAVRMAELFPNPLPRCV